MNDYRPHYYKLEGHKPVACDNVIEWGKWYEEANRHVAETFVGEVRISTVFLGLDHNFGRGGEPLLFETMIFGGPGDEELQRYSTWEQAELGHQLMVEIATRLAEANNNRKEP